MNKFKKNKLIVLIVISMLVGIVCGYIINISITKNKFSYDRTLVSSIKEKKVAEQVEKTLSVLEQRYLKEEKKSTASKFSVLSDLFLHLIKMIIAPLVLAVLVLGVAKVGDFKSVGRIGLKTMIYFTSATLLALALGLVMVNLFEPGKVMHLDLPDAKAETGIKANVQDAKNFIDHVIPESVVRSMAANDILPIVVFALFFGVAIASVGQHG
ncbi:MAG TPA: cation:dicarboxylase symporter family transporter, partial [Bacteroidia bacterium]|nr:cation:dicarboxylase symporter family transporter [Bacteroidia bacterium]